jgi:hypothetical protein
MRYLEHRQTSISSYNSGTRRLPWGFTFLSHIWYVACLRLAVWTHYVFWYFSPFLWSRFAGDLYRVCYLFGELKTFQTLARRLLTSSAASSLSLSHWSTYILILI